MRVLISGGCGFIGRNTSSHLARIGHDVCAVDNFYRPESRSHVVSLAQAGVAVVEADVRRRGQIDSVMRDFRPEAVIHAAGQVSLVRSIEDPLVDFEINALGTLNLLESAATLATPPFFVGITSNKIYGSLDGYNYLETDDRYLCEQLEAGLDESFPLLPVAPYATSKAYADFAVRDYKARGLLPSISLRLSSVVGPDQDSTETQGWVSWLLKEVAGGRPISLSGKGKQVRDVLFVNELAELLGLALRNPDALSSDCYNIGGGPTRALSINELLRFAGNFYGQEVQVRHGPERVGDQKYYVAAIGRIQSDLGLADYSDIRPQLERLAASFR